MPDVKILRTKSYLTMIRNSARGENRMFCSLYASVDGIEQDILKDGQLSCAVFVSSLLMLNKLLDAPRATVDSAEKALPLAGWVEIPEPREGAVLVWSGVTYADGQTHRHIGFSLGEGRAVSNASNGGGCPVEHSEDYDGTRKIERIWWHPSLDE